MRDPSPCQPAAAREVFIRSRRDHLLLREPGSWTGERREARKFSTSLEAIVYSCQHRLPNVDVLITFNSEGVPDVVVPFDIGCSAYCADPEAVTARA